MGSGGIGRAEVGYIWKKWSWRYRKNGVCKKRGFGDRKSGMRA